MADRSTLRDETDEQLVGRLQRAGPGDLRAFDVLVERHQSKVMTNCRYISGSVVDAPDLSQEVFVKAFFALNRFEGRSSFATWIQRIKTNHCINHLKKKRRAMVDVDDPAVAGEGPMSVDPAGPENIERLAARDMIRTVLDTMGDNLRVPLIMRDMDGFSYQDIADELEIGLSAVKMRILRARQEFRDRYTELEEGLADAAPPAA